MLYGMDLMDVEIAARWSGENGAFMKTLHDLRLLDCPACPPRESWQPHDIVLPVEIHDWPDWQGWAFFSEERSARASKAASARWGAREEKDASCGPHKKKMRSASKTNAGGNATSTKNDAPSPAPAPPPTPEKEEQSSRDDARPLAFEGQAAASSPPDNGKGTLPPVVISLLVQAPEDIRGEAESLFVDGKREELHLLLKGRMTEGLINMLLKKIPRGAEA
jgi:hypothetical protein